MTTRAHRAHTRAPLASALLALALPAAAQQGSGALQVFGQIGLAASYKTLQTGGGSLKELADTSIHTSFIGLRGQEDLGGRLRAVFRLESVLVPDVGQTGQGSRFWNRQSYVGLDYGRVITVTLGRQFHVATERVVQTFDVYNLGGSNAHAAPLGLIGVNRLAGNDSRADNAIKLRVRGPLGLTAGLSVSAGEGSGSRSYSVEASQITPDYAVGAFFTRYEAPMVQAATGARPEQQVWGLGAQAPVGPVRLYLTWIDNRLDSTVAGRVTQHNQLAIAGVSWQASAQTTVKVSYTHDEASRLNGLTGRDGKKTTWVSSAEYALSKRTSLYVAASQSDFCGGYRLDPVNIAALGRDPAASSTRQLSTGMRQVF